MIQKKRGAFVGLWRCIKSFDHGTRQMKNFDEELFLGDLASVDWRSIVSDSGSLDDAVS